MSDLPDLLPVDVSPELAAMLKAYPLPEGAQDADLNMDQIAAIFEVSANSVAKWVRHEGMPVVQEGGNGKAYVLRASHCWAWRHHKLAEDAQEKMARDRVVSDLQMQFQGIEPDDEHIGLTPKQQKEAAEAAYRTAQVREMRRQLVRLNEVVELIESLFKTMRSGSEALSDRLERELNLKPEEVAVVDRAVNDTLNKIVSQISEAELQERDLNESEASMRLVI